MTTMGTNKYNHLQNIESDTPVMVTLYSSDWMVLLDEIDRVIDGMSVVGKATVQNIVSDITLQNLSVIVDQLKLKGMDPEFLRVGEELMRRTSNRLNQNAAKAAEIIGADGEL